LYGLAAQELEVELGGVVSYISGAAGSSHNCYPGIEINEAIQRIKAAVKEALARSEFRTVRHVAAIKRELTFRVRQFDDKAENDAITAHCERWLAAQDAPHVVESYRKARQKFTHLRGTEQTTWIQSLRIGDICFVGVPGEYFTVLGEDIKRRSPFRHTYIAGLANDAIGYLPDAKGFDLGGYQIWTGFQSYAARETGEDIADAVVELLEEMRATP
jgi:hypothetical protein